MRLGLARTRLLVSAAVGGVVAASVAAVAPWQLATLAGWCVAAVVMVGWVLIAILPLDASLTAGLAKREDNSRFMADALLLSSSTASLVGVGVALVKAGHQDGAAQAVTTATAVLTVVLSWTVVHVTYLLRYARLYYSGDQRGIAFGGDDAPDYRDFAYLAFTVGMTYQVSDTDLTTKAIRRTATHHALLSYVFGTVVVAITINVVAGLFH